MIDDAMFDPEAKCINCGCTDSQACSEGCEWIVVDYEAGLGICSSKACNTDANLEKLKNQIKELQK